MYFHKFHVLFLCVYDTLSLIHALAQSYVSDVPAAHESQLMACCCCASALLQRRSRHGKRPEFSLLGKRHLPQWFFHVVSNLQHLQLMMPNEFNFQLWIWLQECTVDSKVLQYHLKLTSTVEEQLNRKNRFRMISKSHFNLRVWLLAPLKRAQILHQWELYSNWILLPHSLQHAHSHHSIEALGFQSLTSRNIRLLWAPSVGPMTLNASFHQANCLFVPFQCLKPSPHDFAAGPKRQPLELGRLLAATYEHHRHPKTRVQPDWQCSDIWCT